MDLSIERSLKRRGVMVEYAPILGRRFKANAGIERKNNES